MGDVGEEGCKIKDKSKKIKVFYTFGHLNESARIAGPSDQNLPGGQIPRGASMQRWPIPPSDQEDRVLYKVLKFKI